MKQSASVVDMDVDAVHGEPSAAPNSLFIRKKQEN
jgi:hypothetical protein